SDEPLDCPFSSMYSFGLHGISPSDTMIPYVALFMQGYILSKSLPDQAECVQFFFQRRTALSSKPQSTVRQPICSQATLRISALL
ncbi:MAG: hypothetical protein ABSH06_30815, partial [Thermodesulfobacteriota bacterium]